MTASSNGSESIPSFKLLMFPTNILSLKSSTSMFLTGNIWSLKSKLTPSLNTANWSSVTGKEEMAIY